MRGEVGEREETGGLQGADAGAVQRELINRGGRLAAGGGIGGGLGISLLRLGGQLLGERAEPAGPELELGNGLQRLVGEAAGAGEAEGSGEEGEQGGVAVALGYRCLAGTLVRCYVGRDLRWLRWLR